MERVVKPKRDKYLFLNSKASLRTTDGNNTLNYSWRLNSPIEINENAYLQVVNRTYEPYVLENATTLEPYVIRLISTSSPSIVHTATRDGTPITQGTIIDIGYPFRDADKAIEVELPPATAINDITLSINNDLSTNTGIATTIEFMIVLKITEREPETLVYGSLNNSGIQSYGK
jgi:hypothetical protein